MTGPTEPIPPDDDGGGAFVEAMTARVSAPHPGAEAFRRLDELARRADAPFELHDPARARRDQYLREGEQLRDVLATESDRVRRSWFDRWFVLADDPTVFGPRDLLRGFTADTAGTGGEDVYRVSWGQVDGGPQTGSAATTDPRAGTFSASHYATGDTVAFSYAGIGVRFHTKLPVGVISVRPYVDWKAWDLLDSRRYDPDVGGDGWAQAQTAIGVHVQSRAPGGPVTNDGGRWVTMTSSAQVDPSRAWHDDDGTVGAPTVGADGIVARSDRETVVWVSCYAWTRSQSVFNLDTRASAEISCRMPFVFVREDPPA